MPSADSFPDPGQLLDAAQLLVDRGEHPGHWRRSISSSYYASFHAVTGAGAALIFQEDLVAGRGRRWFEHRAVAAVAQAVTSANEQEHWEKLGFGAPPSRPISETCQKLVSLQRRREDADYAAPIAGVPRATEAHKALADARAICDAVERFVGPPPDEQFLIVVAEMMSRSVRRSRHGR